MSTMTDAEMEAMMAEIEEMSSTAPVAPAAKPAVAAAKSVATEPEAAPPWEERDSAPVETVEDFEPEDEVPEPVAAKPVAVEPKPAVAEVKPAPAPEPAPAVEAVRPKPAAVASGDGTALNTFIDTDQVKMDISINSADLDTAMITHPGLELHYATQTAHARRQYERLKSAVEILEAKIDADVREKWVGEKKPTEAAIKASVLADKRYSSAQSKLIDAQHIWKLCEATENAFRSRKDLLLEVARDRRKEREGQMRVLEGQEMRDSVLKMLRDAKAA